MYSAREPLPAVLGSARKYPSKQTSIRVLYIVTNHRKQTDINAPMIYLLRTFEYALNL